MNCCLKILKVSSDPNPVSPNGTITVWVKPNSLLNIGTSIYLDSCTSNLNGYFTIVGVEEDSCYTSLVLQNVDNHPVLVTNCSCYTIVGIQGPTGSQGPTGDVIGVTGLQGPTGLPGQSITGPTGFIQLNGNYYGDYIYWNTTQWVVGSEKINLGQNAGQFNQQTGSVALGLNAGTSNQGTGSIAIGFNAGFIAQGQNSIAIGLNAGQTGQAPNCIAIGQNAGQINQNTGSSSVFEACVAIGNDAGVSNQGFGSVAVGNRSALSNQGPRSVAIGRSAGSSNQGNGSVSVGYQSAQSNQGVSSIAIGLTAGLSNLGSNSIAIGSTSSRGVAKGSISNYVQSANTICIGSDFCGDVLQGPSCIAIGQSAGRQNQGAIGLTGITGTTGPSGTTGTYSFISGVGNCIAIGNSAGLSNQGGVNLGGTGSDGFSIAIGFESGKSNQQQRSVAIGVVSGQTTQYGRNVAIGDAAGQTSQGIGGPINNSLCVAVGTNAGNLNQSYNSVAIGAESGVTSQGFQSTGVGYFAGWNKQGKQAVAVGAFAGQNIQSDYAVAVGYRAGLGGTTPQGSNAIAIGYQAGYQNQSSNSIILNASGTTLDSFTSGFFVNPIRSTGATGSALYYNSATSEILVSTSKTFVIEHPLDPNKYLVHACLEGPEAGVYYRGVDEILQKSVVITLPSYASAIASEFTVHITPLIDDEQEDLILCNATSVKNNQFKVISSHPCKFTWFVMGKRLSIDVEVDKDSTQVKGNGPYKWI
jgi:hypothetical protein